MYSVIVCVNYTFSRFDIIPRCARQTDRQTDRQTHTHTHTHTHDDDYIYRASIASLGKNHSHDQKGCMRVVHWSVFLDPGNILTRPTRPNFSISLVLDIYLIKIVIL